MEKGKTSLKDNAEHHRILGEQIKLQQERVEKLSDMVEKASEKFGEADTKTLRWKQALYEAETELNGLKDQMKNLPTDIQIIGERMEAAGEKISNAGEKISSFGRNIQPISAGAAAILGGSLKSAVDFETAFTGVQKTVDATEGEYEDLAEWIKQASTEMASSKGEIAGVMEVSGQLGVSGVKDLEAFTKTMVMLGDTTNLSAEDAATSLARFMNITGGSYQDSEKLGSAIVDLGNNFATSESEIVEMATRLASAGTIAGLSQTDILALAASMSSVGIQAEAGGTAMTQTLSSIEKAVSAAEEGSTEDLEKFAKVAGMTADDFARTWRSKPISAVQNFIDGLGKMDEKNESTVSTLEDLGLSGIRQSNMLNSLALANEVLADAIDTSSTAWNDQSALQEEADKRYDTTAAKLEQTKEHLTNIGIEIGERLLPYADRLLTGIDQLIGAWDGLSEEEQNQLINAALIVAAASPVMTIVGKTAGVVGGLATAAGKAAGVVGGLGSVMEPAATSAGILGTNAGAASTGIAGIIAPAGLALGAVALLGGAFVTAYKNDEEFARKVDEDWAEIKTTITETIAVIKPEWEAFSEFMTPVFTGALEGIQQGLEAFKTNFEGWMDIIHGVLDGDWTRAWEGAQKVAGSSLEATTLKADTEGRIMEGIFKNLKLEMPMPRVPEFYTEGEGIFGLPKIHVRWKADAMKNGMILNSPTVFGATSSGLLAGGEAGNEWIIGENSILGMIRSAVRSSVGYIPEGNNTVNIGDTQIVINAAPGQDVEEIADAVDEIITARYEQMRAAWA